MIKNFVQEYFDKEKKLIERISLENFEEIIRLLSNAYEKENQIFIFGNGGSGSTASHFACDLNKGISLGLKKRYKVICLNDNIPTILAYANDRSYDDIFIEQLKNFLRPKDIVIGISVSGKSQNVIKAIKYANEIGAETVTITGFDGGKLAKEGKVSLIVPSDDMQQVEDIHLILMHMTMQILYKK